MIVYPSEKYPTREVLFNDSDHVRNIQLSQQTNSGKYKRQPSMHEFEGRDMARFQGREAPIIRHNFRDKVAETERSPKRFRERSQQEQIPKSVPHTAVMSAGGMFNKSNNAIIEEKSEERIHVSERNLDILEEQQELSGEHVLVDDENVSDQRISSENSDVAMNVNVSPTSKAKLLLNVDSSASLEPFGSAIQAPTASLPSDIRDDMLRSGTMTLP